ncbi:CD3324 family protein [Alkalihalobacillus pseudalcaliphilus]|uniref:CD3324 family protein n=1 Tax=Alkalihalobacillus pseudalcaliphilus TaxID=79884 RepID=UPI00064DC649|nr:CD3324 family protein [Alkalihalobacillus pseudalcaliphilus]KMK76231.1 histidine kinase [Alkalihalobacillus pseudalcaliphilus]
MSYMNAQEVLPKELIDQIQHYVDGKPLYIPRKENKRSRWGEKNGTRKQLAIRNHELYQDYLSGVSKHDLMERYYLSDKSIQRIIRVQGQLNK